VYNLRPFVISAFASLLYFSVVAAAGELTLQVPGKTIELSTSDWEKVADKTKFARNYFAKKPSPLHQYNRMVTVYLNPMSDDRRIGLKISDFEYLEFFIVNPGFVTAQTRVDKGKYWVLCRETFHPKDNLPIDISAYKPFLSKNENQLLWITYQVEVDQTRYLLNSKF